MSDESGIDSSPRQIDKDQSSDEYKLKWEREWETLYGRGKKEVLEKGSEYYKGGSIQPIEYIHANCLSFCEGNVVKYITRHGYQTREKAISDLQKAKHYIDIILKQEYDYTD